MNASVRQSSHAQAVSSGSPWRVGPVSGVKTGVVLVGTASTIRQMHAAIDGLGDKPVVSGAVLVPGGGEVAGGPPVLGSVSDLPVLAPRLGLKLALVCLPNAIAGREALLAKIAAAGVPMREMPAIEDILGIETRPSGPEVKITGAGAGLHSYAGAQPRIDLGELIGRKPYDMDREAVARVMTGKRVLITGAGGSIGSELAKVAASLDPELLVLMERSENALFEIDRQIARHFPSVKRRAILHDVVDAEATMRACAKIRPSAVFHAAAHKHVPLMEDHPAHAVSNNVFGTKSIADAAVESGAERFVLISSDKAVNPTSVMGATKRLAEMYVRGLGDGPDGRGCATRMSMVRFGNVLGSNASVLTIWAQQIAEGGPITITDPRMTRYFMTIPEAATLVVQSTTLDAEGSESGGVGVYVLDMGEPLRIVDLAVRFARAHGLEPRLRFESGSPEIGEAGIDVVTTGIRSGEKLYEELAYPAEQLLPTSHPGIRAWGGPGFKSRSADELRRMIAELHAARFSQDHAAVVRTIRSHVPEMRSSLEVGTEKPALPVG